MLTLQARGAFGFSEQAASIAVAARTGCDGRRTDSEDSHHATGMAIDDNPSDRDLAVNHSDVKVPIAGCHSLDQASESSADSSRPRTDARSMRKRRSGGTDSSAVLAAAARPGKVARAHDRIAAGGALASALPQAEAAAGASPGKKARMSWDTELHRSFLSALQKLGLRAAVPKTIMQARRLCLLVCIRVIARLRCMYVLRAIAAALCCINILARLHSADAGAACSHVVELVLWRMPQPP